MSDAVKMLFVIIGVLTISACADCDNRPHIPDVDDTLEEPDWPVYRAGCLIFQVPDQFDVVATAIWKHFGVSIVDANNNDDVLASLSYARFQARTPCNLSLDNAVEMDVGGMASYLVEEIENGKYSGEICIDASSYVVNEVYGSFKGLTREERDLLMKIFRSFRINRDQHLGEPDEYPSKIGVESRINPISDPDLARPVIELRPGQICP